MTVYVQQEIITETGEIVPTDGAWDRHQRIVGYRNLAEKTFLALGEELYWFEKKKQYKDMGHKTFESYLADPDVDISRQIAFQLKRVFQTYILDLKVLPVVLLPAGYSKLDMVRSVIDESNKDEWIKKAETLSRSDLQAEIDELKRNKFISDDIDLDNPDLELREGDAVVLLKGIDSESVDLLVIDPPYNINKASWDKLGTGDEYAKWASRWLEECKRVLKSHGSIYVFGYNRMLSYIQHLLEKQGFVYRDWIIWDTIEGAGGGLWVNRYEGILFYSKTKETYTDPESVKLERHESNIREYAGKVWEFKSPSNIWRIPRVDASKDERVNHPTQKPVEIIERMINASSPPGGVVLDPFIGSGTTAVAALKNKRSCVGFDVNPEYIELTKYRVSKEVKGNEFIQDSVI